MAKTLISDIIQSARWQAYYRLQVVARNALIASGAVAPDSKVSGLAGSKGAATVNCPFWNAVTGASQVLSDSAALTVGKITAGKHRAYILARGDARSVNDLADIRSGGDPAQALAAGLADMWATDEQTIALAVLKGVMADNVANDSGDQYLDIYSDIASPAAANQLTGSTFVDAKAKFGDAAAKLVLVAMHSDVYFALQKLELISIVRPSDDIEFETFQGRRIIVDDSMPTTAGSNSSEYTTYLLGAGALARDEGWPGPQPAFESDRDILTGDTVIASRKQLILHPQGFDGTSSSIAADTPTNAELEAAGNWDRVVDRKLTAIVAVRHNVAA